MYQLEPTQRQLWHGCILGFIAHAISTARYPLFSHEQSWDGANYSVQDSAGQRGTVSFGDYCIAAFRNDHSPRMRDRISASCYFQGAPVEVQEYANRVTLAYLLDHIDGEVKPSITTAFWGANALFSTDTFDDMMEHGGELLAKQFMDNDQAILEWQEECELTDRQVQLLESLYSRKVSAPNTAIHLTRDDIHAIDAADHAGQRESKALFEQVGIYWR